MRQLRAGAQGEPVNPMSFAQRTGRNIVYNLLGQCLPAVLTIWAIPLLVHTLGKDRFGLLSVIWVLIGYSNFLDLGISRALTGIIASRLGADRRADVPPLVGTGLALLGIVGLVALIALLLARGWIIGSVFKIPSTLRDEANYSLIFTAVSIPFVVMTAGMRGIFEGHHRFDISNALRTPLSSFMLLGPVFVTPFSHNLAVVTGVLALGRIAGWFAHLSVCLRHVPRRSGLVVDASLVGVLLRFGGWMTVGNLAGSLMSQLDRFVIGAFTSLAALSYYTTPFDLVTRALVLPSAVMAVGFPAFSDLHARRPAETAAWFGRVTIGVFVVMLPLGVIGFVYAPEILRIWLGPEFAIQSTLILRVLTVGTILNALAAVPFALIQAVGRADWTAKLQLVELPFYLAGLVLLLGRVGLPGAAIAWTLRILVDTAANFVLATGLAPESRQRVKRLLYLYLGLAPILFVATLTFSVFLKGLLAVVVLASVFSALWLVVLDSKDRDLCLTTVRGRLGHVTQPAARRDSR